MLKLFLIISVCLLSLNIPGLANGKPVSRFENRETSGSPRTLEVSRVIVSPKKFIELVRYVDPRVLSSSKEVPQGGDSGITRSAVRKIVQTKRRNNFEDFVKAGEKSFDYRNKKLMANENESLSIESFEGYTEGNSNRNPHEILPKNFTIIGSEAIPNNQLLPLTKEKVATPSFVKKESPLSNIRVSNLTIERISPEESENAAAISLPFEAIITFSEEKTSSLSKSKNHNVEVIPIRDPPDDFPPYFKTLFSPETEMVADIGNDRSNLDPLKNTSKKFDDDNDDEDEIFDPMTMKRRLPRVGELIETFAKENTNYNHVNNSKPQDLKASSENNAGDLISVKFDENGTDTRSQNDPTSFQRQEIEEYDDGEEEEGSLGSITDILPLVLPILEDLSNPNTDTDIAELLEAGLPLVQGLSQPNGDNDGIDFVGIISPIIASLSGPSRRGNGTVLQSILPLIIPLITPFIGPIIGPIIQGLGTPADRGGSSITPLIQAIAGPLSLPAMPGGISPAASLISGIIASLSKDLKNSSGQGGSDFGALVTTLVSGVISGGSAGLSAGLMKPVPPPRNNGYGSYGQAPVPASSVDPLDLLTSSVKEIFGLSLQLIKSLVSSLTEILSTSSAEKPKPIYGPPVRVKSSVMKSEIIGLRKF